MQILNKQSLPSVAHLGPLSPWQLSWFQCIDPMKLAHQNRTPRECTTTHEFVSQQQKNKFHLCFISWVTHADKTAGGWWVTRGHTIPPRGIGYRVHIGGGSLSHEVSCIFLYLSTKSHYRWPISRLQTLMICEIGHMKHPVVNKRKTASIYHINTANQIYIYIFLLH